jgi:hypothetical protein
MKKRALSVLIAANQPELMTVVKTSSLKLQAAMSFEPNA